MTVRRHTPAGGVDATCAPIQRHPDDNWLLAPICKAGDLGLFLADASWTVYTPVVRRQ